MMICGKCKNRHETVAEVKACYATVAPAVTAVKTAVAVLERTPVTKPGMYVHDEIVYRVKRSQSGYLYAQRVELFDGKPIYTYAPGVFNTLDASDKMTIEAAEAYSLKINHCCCCGKTLTNTKSVTLGIGPVCRKKYF